MKIKKQMTIVALTLLIIAVAGLFIFTKNPETPSTYFSAQDDPQIYSEEISPESPVNNGETPKYYEVDTTEYPFIDEDLPVTIEPPSYPKENNPESPLLENESSVPLAPDIGYTDPIPGFTLSQTELVFNSSDPMGRFTQNITVMINDSLIYRIGHYVVNTHLDYNNYLYSFNFNSSNGSVYINYYDGSSWFRNNANFTIPFSVNGFNFNASTNFTDNNYIMVYSCTELVNDWDCHEGKWQAYQFSARKV